MKRYIGRYKYFFEHTMFSPDGTSFILNNSWFIRLSRIFSQGWVKCKGILITEYWKTHFYFLVCSRICRIRFIVMLDHGLHLATTVYCPIFSIPINVDTLIWYSISFHSNVQTGVFNMHIKRCLEYVKFNSLISITFVNNIHCWTVIKTRRTL